MVIAIITPATTKNANMIWQELTQHAVRDLAWACFSPPLLHSRHLPGSDGRIDNCELELTPARIEQLRALANNVKIHVQKACASMPAGVDTEADLEKTRKLIAG